jgi:hypothetical protein
MTSPRYYSENEVIGVYYGRNRSMSSSKIYQAIHTCAFQTSSARHNSVKNGGNITPEVMRKNTNTPAS